MILNTPNALTLGRIFAAPALALVFICFHRPLADWLAFILFFAASVTDFLDGWLARRWGQTSELGKMLDPIADKAMVIIALAVLMSARPAEAGRVFSAHTLSALIMLPASLIMLREVMVSGLREYLGDVKLDVTNLAKWKTTVQMVAIGLLLMTPLLVSDTPPDGPSLAGAVLMTGIGTLWFAAFLTAVSGWDYFRKGMVIIRERELKG